MNEMFRTILTGEPLEWQLTNEQRAVFGLPPVEPHWTLTEVPCGLLAMCETYVYLDGTRIMRVISHGEQVYDEFCIDAALTEDGRITPVKPEGTSVKLTAANLYKRRHVGVSVSFNGITGATPIHVEDHDRRRTVVAVKQNGQMTTADFAQWVAAWCRGGAVKDE